MIRSITLRYIPRCLPGQEVIAPPEAKLALRYHSGYRIPLSRQIVGTHLPTLGY